ncbi:MAG: L,D-transpeptidase family protein [Lachnospiraceae bacterium]|jgi:hypothetical protein|nr:L,D-transpeptidase family protein [Lachnospiraceae bacterium]MDD3616080.1 L,D-transpeptidase family protein [Lachnospiraceae bacterium]
MKNKSKALKITIGILIAFVVIVIGAYMAVAQYFKTHYYTGSMINGIDATGKTVEEVRAIINDELKEYSITITGRTDKSLTITGADIDLTYVDDNTLQKLMEDQEPYKWISSMSNKKDYTMSANTEYDKEKLVTLMKQSPFLAEDQVTVPADAYMDENETGYYIVPEVVGDKMNEETVLSMVEKAVDGGEVELNFGDECYEAPTVLSNNEALVAKCNKLNVYLSNSITIPFGTGRQETIVSAQVKEWIVEGEDGSLSLNQEAIAAVVHDWARKYDTFGLAHNFKTHAGNTITIPAGGDYGWAMHQPKTVEALVAALEEGGVRTFEPVYRYSAMSRDENDIGGTYVEVSITEQKMWCYKDGRQIVETPVVTGLPTEDRMTHTGLYAIDAKKSPDVLSGQGYDSEVTYWMPFNGNEGIHDADRWRTEYGGTIYQSSGSHGCVNTPLDAVATIYNTVQIGTAVIVY